MRRLAPGAVGLVLLALVARRLRIRLLRRLPAAPAVSGTATEAGTTAYDAALSSPREDSVYPVGRRPRRRRPALRPRPVSWDPDRTVLTGDRVAAVPGRHGRRPPPARPGPPAPGRPGVARRQSSVAFRHDSKDLVVEAPMTSGDRHLLQLTYSGTPEPVKAPTDRADFDTTGWTTTRDGSVWTMQEPYGAYSWYAVNDQPSDKAFYDVSVSAPPAMVGVANGRMLVQGVRGRPHRDPLAARRAGGVVPRDDRDR